MEQWSARHRVGQPLPLILSLLSNTLAESEFNNVLWKLNPPSPRTQTGLTPQTHTCAVPSKVIYSRETAMDNLNIRVQGNGETIALLDKLIDTGMLEELVNPNIEDRFYRITPVGDRFLERTHELARLAGNSYLVNTN